MKETRKEMLSTNVSEGKKDNAVSTSEVARSVQPQVVRLRVNEQARRRIMEKYKYGDKYHD